MAALSASLLLLAAVVLLYWARPDALAWFTLWPLWLWLLPGGAVLLPGLVARWRPGWLAVLLWLATIGLLADETGGLLRRKGAPRGQLRVATLNCAAGQRQPAEALAAYQPDLVLLQEAPSARDCWTIARKLYGPSGKAHWALETAVVSRFRLSAQASDPLVWSRVVVATDTGPLEVISLRLAPVPLCLNLLSANCRAGLVENRRRHRRELSAVVEELGRLPADTPLVVAGDFNAPAGDAIFRLFPAALQDVWEQAGRGWGNTCVADLPTARIDQIWARPPLRPVHVRAVALPGSDHRAVLADFVWD